MTKKLYVGNLPYSVNDNDLKNLFASYGSVTSASVIADRDTGRAKGFGFVEMDSAEEAEQAIEALNGSEVDGRKIIVNEARPQEKRESRGGGRRGGFNGRGGDRGNRNY